MHFLFLCTGFFTSEPPILLTISVSVLLVSFTKPLHRDFKCVCARMRAVHTEAESGTVHNEATGGEQETGRSPLKHTSGVIHDCHVDSLLLSAPYKLSNAAVLFQPEWMRQYMRKYTI